jgi:hypothetical protein
MLSRARMALMPQSARRPLVVGLRTVLSYRTICTGTSTGTTPIGTSGTPGTLFSG